MRPNAASTTWTSTSWPPRARTRTPRCAVPATRSGTWTGWSSLRGEIIKGNLFQAVLSRRLVIETELAALEAYRSLRSANPSPYMFYLDYGDFQLFGASPEVHVKVTDGRAMMRPIAGTRRRGKDHREDVALQEDLLSDEKELAEHLMLVDLARNDLGRVAQAGSVEMTERNVIERYSHVMHIVSQVEADLRPGLTGADAVRATFPAGTVSGAPKIQAMETLDALESETRGFYAGIVGYMEPNGTLTPAFRSARRSRRATGWCCTRAPASCTTRCRRASTRRRRTSCARSPPRSACSSRVQGGLI